MKREEAIELLVNATYSDEWQGNEQLTEANLMAIEALQELPKRRKEAKRWKRKALQREIPKNPIVNYVADSDGARRLNEGWTEDSYLCPVCHTYFGTVYNEGYCRKCGQKLIQKRVRVIEK